MMKHFEKRILANQQAGYVMRASLIFLFVCVLLAPRAASGRGEVPQTFTRQEQGQDLDLAGRLLPVTENNILRTEGYFNWGASIVKGPDGSYHLFYSRWKKEYRFTGWLTHSEIAHAVSDNPAGPWEYVETVLRGRGKGHWDAITAHNPKIKYFEGKYYLYYCATNMGSAPYTEADLVETAQTGYSHPNWKILRPNQRTGVAVAQSLSGPWTRMDRPLIEPSGPITTLTVNPAIDRGPDGRYYLVVKGDKPNETRFIRNQAVAISDSPAGPFEIQPRPVIDYIDTEDMSIWYDATRSNFFGIFHSNEEGRFIGLVQSSDGIHWEKAGNYHLMKKRVRMIDGTYLQPDRLERPFVYAENGSPQVLSLAARDGDESYTIFIPMAEPVQQRPAPPQLAWQEAEFGVLVCYELHTFNEGRYNQPKARVTPVEDVDQFNPEQLDTDQWIRAARDAGATFAILTASHESGFRLWQSDVNPYCLKAVEWGDGKRDIVAEFVASCRKYGIEPGIYMGTRWNAHLGVYDFKVTERSPITQEAYNRMIEEEVREICSSYGPLFELWFDGGAHGPAQGGPDVLGVFEQYQPDALFYHSLERADARWGGSETGTMPYPCWATFPFPSTGAGESAAAAISANSFALLKHGDPDGTYWMPAMSDAPLRGHGGHEWFWEPGDEKLIYPLDDLVDMYCRSVGHNSTLILGITPDTDGLIPEADLQRLQEMGAAIKQRFSDPVAEGRGVGKQVHLDLQGMYSINQVVIGEDIEYGERVRKFVLEGKTESGWQKILEGSCIGHKFIGRFEDIEISEARLIVTEDEGTPLIRHFALYQSPEAGR
jgi:alpha-L-fucosidase